MQYSLTLTFKQCQSTGGWLVRLPV